MAYIKPEVTKIVLAKIPAVTKKKNHWLVFPNNIKNSLTFQALKKNKQIILKYSSKQTTCYFTHFSSLWWNKGVWFIVQFSFLNVELGKGQKAAGKISTKKPLI